MSRVFVAEGPDLATLAAAYPFGLVKNHGYVDGSNCTAFMAAYVFLGLNGHDLETDEPNVASTIEQAASGRRTQPDLAAWFRAHMRSVA